MQLCHEWPPGEQGCRRKPGRNVSCTAQGESADLVDEEQGGHASIDEIRQPRCLIRRSVARPWCPCSITANVNSCHTTAEQGVSWVQRACCMPCLCAAP